MRVIELAIIHKDVLDEVSKITDYIGSKLTNEETPDIRDKMLATEYDLNELGRFWEEAINVFNEVFKECLVSGNCSQIGTPEGLVYAFTPQLEISQAFDISLKDTLQSIVRSYMIASIAGCWFKFISKEESTEFLTQAGEHLMAAERVLYSRKRPKIPGQK